MNRDESIAALLTKGVSEILPNKEYLEAQLKSGKRLVIYNGIDPTAATLHIGHAIVLRKLRQFQDLGHKVIFLIGDFTARIGDPTDKLSARKRLTEKEIEENLRLYKKQASKFLRFTGKNKAEIKFNSKWLGKLRFADIISLASLVTVEQMQKRDMFARRAIDGKPTYLHEFLYPLMQGYDSVAMNVDGEVGGNDQLFNMLTGRTLLKQLRNKEKFVITMKLLEDGTGKKMGKTEGNAVSFTDTPEEMYQKIMSWPDGLILPAFELCTNMTLEEVEQIKQKLEHENPRDIKMQLARTIVSEVSGEKIAQDAEISFRATFQRGQSSSLVKKIPQKEVLREALIREGLVPSNSELRRLVLSGSITFISTNEKITLEQLDTPISRGVYRIGKDRFFEIV